MNSNVEEIRALMLQLLDVTQRKTRLARSGIDPERVVFNDIPIWRVRDVVGHIGVWNGEAAHSLRAHAMGGEYHCIESEMKYDEYNAAAVEERRAWNIDQVWAEYEASSNELKLFVETVPDENWNTDMLYPWNERGTVRKLIEIMMKHEVEHREIMSGG
ncbi:MAG: hypothetical protein A2029_02530 [Chloroflexi bacterium RBG_19FT_COMBO_47_9]|uniref:DinB-like domain-containing protein n=1 Tax=Candidatus Woykebacteria bacterium RBG_13_40_15 TaxID=1802593 RepID=A0A1G1W852_9BACT|nr:MAG: hypothetical protein A2029_02530 [Chloroflexi bacterium RBG_19FT_COMBO_47_9]OGY23801.1 MAG: hypothetical protein A2172_01830 [Candidatus Woykebacteria bacterium RBG_13_40_15]